MSAYFKEAELQNLSQYKYSGVDKSLLSLYILNPFWKWAASFAPIWLAPNLITLLGLCFPVMSLALTVYYCPTATEDAPAWFYYFFAIGLFIYQTLDNIDGKQARATGTSSPLGELFDHGCDALNVTITAMTTAAAMRTGPTIWFWAIVLTGLVPFYFSTWEEYHTHTLYLGVINGPVEGILLVVVVALITGYVGSWFWLTDTNTLFGTSIAQLAGMPFNVFMAIFMVLPVGFVLLLSVINVYNTGVSLTRIGIEMAPLAAFLACFAAWAAVDMPFWRECPYLPTLIGTLLFGRMVGRMILAHLLRQEFPLRNWTLIIPLALAANAYNNTMAIDAGRPVYAPSWTAALTALGLTACVYAHMVRAVINGFCRHLKINCLTIPYKKAK